MGDLMRKALERVESAELFRIDRETTPIALDDNGLEAIATRQNTGQALRVIHEGRLGFASSNDLEHSETLLDAACAAARFGEPTDMSFVSTPPHEALPLSDPRLEAMSLEDMVALGESTHRRLKALVSDVEVQVEVTRRVDRVSIRTSHEVEVEESRGALTVVAALLRAKSGDILTLDRSIALRVPDEEAIEAMLERLVARLRQAERLAVAPSGELPVVFGPSAALALLLPVLFGCNGRMIQLGMSPLAGRLGQEVFDPRFTLVDDGRNEQGMWAGSFDDEGTPSRRTILVDKGVLTSFQYDRRTACACDAEVTGNGRREGRWYEPSEYRTPPAPSFSNICVAAGDRPVSDLIGQVGRGLWIEQVLGLGQGNLNSGDFSNTVGVGFLIEGGEIVGRVKNVMIAGNSYRLLKENLIGLSDAPEWFFGRICCPAIAISGVSISSKG